MTSYWLAYLIGTYVLFKITAGLGVTIPLIVISILSGIFFAGLRSSMPQYLISKGKSPKIDPGESATIAALAILVNLIATAVWSLFWYSLWH